MIQRYSDPSRESDPHALPDVTTFQARHGDCPFCTSTIVEDSCGEFHCDACADGRHGVIPEEINTGWFYWFCFPGCMPDSEPSGPFTTETEALADIQSLNQE